MALTITEFEDIMRDERIKTIIVEIEKDNALEGLKIIAKYLPKSGVEGASHDVIWGAGVEELVIAGITKEDAIKLKELNWMIDDDSLACFV